MTWIIVVAIIFLALFFKPNKKKSSKGGASKFHAITKTNLMTPHELALFHKLVQQLPNHYICPQVSFGALLTSTAMATRGTFMQKRTDYVIIDKNGDVAAIVELDDPSHRNRGKNDALRDAMLKDAGYSVIRFPKQPTKEDVARRTQFITETSESLMQKIINGKAPN